MADQRTFGRWRLKNWHDFSIQSALELKFYKKSAIFHSIKLPFDAEVDEKFSNVIYYVHYAGIIDTFGRHAKINYLCM